MSRPRLETAERATTVEDGATREAKQAILGTANAVAGAIDFLDRLADGASLGEAFDHAYERAKKRKKAIREGDR